MEQIAISGKEYSVNRLESKNKNAWGRLRGDTIVISIPSRWPKKEKDETFADLLKRAVRAIEKGKWSPQKTKKLEFSHGQRISALGKEFEISFISSKRFGSAFDGDILRIKVVENHPYKQKIASKLAQKKLAEALKPKVLERVHAINNAHFNAAISKVMLRDNSSRWGSCNRSGVISLNLRLLFMPQVILDYVIVHELAHTKYMSHGKRFWALVEKIIPDHREKRKWLKENGWKLNHAAHAAPASGGQQTLDPFICEEPY